MLDFIAIYTDGACSGNPGPGGWGAIVLDSGGDVAEYGDGERGTTNNRMELSAALVALRKVAQRGQPAKQIMLFTDSTYLIRGITQWVWGWRNRGWTTAEGNEVQSRDLWEDLIRVTTEIQQNLITGGSKKIEWNYVRGHKGVPGNERCDRIAVAFSQGNKPGLFRGKLRDYSIDVLSFPELEGLPEMKPKVEKQKAHSYLSYVDGTVMRHADWASCERRVKGRSGAKFKKAMSAQEEPEILAAWGKKTSDLKND
ncbi:MAG: reverse transcriptase-like protein [Bdellovibrionaceae bacterium]|nr:reverse transcriptase-like protein [Pseudobdellovibrionaceae bacterium]MBX3032515.1 reverse transcriptase-like protein [Pseudobdellovibrionaceae bacterium]